MLWWHTSYRCTFFTETGELGLGPLAAREGDSVVVLWGAQVPFVVRERDGGSFILLGECYIEELMDGQALGRLDRGEDGVVERMFEFR
jgi:hypothetical protein